MIGQYRSREFALCIVNGSMRDTFLKMAEAGRFANVEEEEISQIINSSDPIPDNTKRQTTWSVSVFNGKLSYQVEKIKTTIFLLCMFVVFLC